MLLTSLEIFLDYKEPGDFVERVKAACDGLGPHAALMVSSGGAAYAQGKSCQLHPILRPPSDESKFFPALDYLRPHGTLVAVGLPPDTTINASVFWTVFKALRIVGSYVGNRGGE